MICPQTRKLKSGVKVLITNVKTLVLCFQNGKAEWSSEYMAYRIYYIFISLADKYAINF